MSTAVELAVANYIRVWSEPDPSARAVLLEACWADEGRLVTRSREIRGRAALAAEIARLHADPLFLKIRVHDPIDAKGTTFRFRATLDHRDGTSAAETFDAGEIDTTGRISLILTFAGPLAAA
jgi:hypothetical protein